MSELTVVASSGMLRFLYDFDHRAITLNLADFTHEESLVAPPPAGNCANWVLGHILVHRSIVLDLLGGEPLWKDGECPQYETASKPLDPADARPFASLLADFETTQERIRAALDAVDPARLEEKHTPDAKRPCGQQVQFLQFHEAYHAGQLGLLRRMVGKKGAI